MGIAMTKHQNDEFCYAIYTLRMAACHCGDSPLSWNSVQPMGQREEGLPHHCMLVYTPCTTEFISLQCFGS